MERRDILQERYEDALFALLMDEVAKNEGIRGLEENERLKHDPKFQFPEELDRRCKRTIRKSFTKQTAWRVGRFTFRSLKKITMIVGIAAMLFTSAFATSETVRVNTLNLVIEVFEGGTNFYFETPPQYDRIEVGWVPSEFALEEQGKDGFSIWYQYRKSDTEYIFIEHSTTDGIGFGIDTEDAEISEVEVNGVKGMWIKAENYQQLILLTSNQETMVRLVAEGLSEKEFLHVAGELKYR